MSCLCFEIGFLRAGPTLGISHSWLQRAWTETRWACEQRAQVRVGGARVSGCRPGVLAPGKIRRRCPQMPRRRHTRHDQGDFGHQDERGGCCTLETGRMSPWLQDCWGPTWNLCTWRFPWASGGRAKRRLSPLPYPSPSARPQATPGGAQRAHKECLPWEAPMGCCHPALLGGRGRQGSPTP